MHCNVWDGQNCEVLIKTQCYRPDLLLVLSELVRTAYVMGCFIFDTFLWSYFLRRFARMSVLQLTDLLLELYYFCLYKISMLQYPSISFSAERTSRFYYTKRLQSDRCRHRWQCYHNYNMLCGLSKWSGELCSYSALMSFMMMLIVSKTLWYSCYVYWFLPNHASWSQDSSPTLLHLNHGSTDC